MTSCQLQDVKIFSTSSEKEALVRKQSNEVIYSYQKEFDNYKCVSDEDFTKILIKLQQCD